MHHSAPGVPTSGTLNNSAMTSDTHGFLEPYLCPLWHLLGSLQLTFGDSIKVVCVRSVPSRVLEWTVASCIVLEQQANKLSLCGVWRAALLRILRWAFVIFWGASCYHISRWDHLWCSNCITLPHLSNGDYLPLEVNSGYIFVSFVPLYFLSELHYLCISHL
jgi:hypothetical protein